MIGVLLAGSLLSDCPWWYCPNSYWCVGFLFFGILVIASDSEFLIRTGENNAVCEKTRKFRPTGGTWEYSIVWVRTCIYYSALLLTMLRQTYMVAIDAQEISSRCNISYFMVVSFISMKKMIKSLEGLAI